MSVSIKSIPPTVYSGSGPFYLNDSSQKLENRDASNPSGIGAFINLEPGGYVLTAEVVSEGDAAIRKTVGTYPVTVAPQSITYLIITPQ
jgi:hypothetical protein